MALKILQSKIVVDNKQIAIIHICNFFGGNMSKTLGFKFIRKDSGRNGVFAKSIPGLFGIACRTAVGISESRFCRRWL
jgi:hypothetical protein